MAKPTFVSVVDVVFDGTSGDTESIAVPSGANYAVISGSYYTSDEGAVTISGSWYTQTGIINVLGSAGSAYAAFMSVGEVTATGTQNITIARGNFFSEGPTCQIAFYTVDDPSDALNDGPLGVINTNHNVVFTQAINSDADCVVLAGHGKDAGGTFGALTGWTQRGSTQTVLGAHHRFMEVDTAGDPTTTASTTNLDWPSLTVVSLKGASGGGGQTLSPSLLTNSQTFHAPTVTRGAVSVAPPLLTNGQTFYSPTITGGVTSLFPPLLTNSQTFYAPTVTRGAVSVLPPLLTNSQTFYAPAVRHPGAFASDVLADTGPVGGNPAGIMYAVAGTVGGGVWMSYRTISGPTPGGGTLTEYPDGRFTYVGGAPAVWVVQIELDGVDHFETTTVYLYDQEFTLLPPLLTNSQTFYAPTVARGAVSVAPPLLTNSQTFHAPTVARGAVSVAPPLLTNDQTFYGPTVSIGTATLSPPLLTNDQTFYGPTVTGGAAVVSPPLLTNSQTFFAPAVSGGAVTVSPPLLVNTTTIFAPRVRMIVPPGPGGGGGTRICIGIRIGL